MHYKKHEVRRYVVRTRLLAPRTRGVSAALGGSGSASATPAPRVYTVPLKRAPQE